MADTHKDAPLRVQKLRALKEGRVQHDHRHPQGKSRWRRLHLIQLDKSFSAQDEASIVAHRRELATLPQPYSFEEKEDFLFGDKKVIFRVYWSEQLFTTAFCTDWEHYDIQKDSDVRDGGRITCEGKLNFYDGRRQSKHWTATKRKEAEQAAVRDELIALTKDYNSNGSLAQEGATATLLERFSDKVYFY